MPTYNTQLPLNTKIEVTVKNKKQLGKITGILVTHKEPKYKLRTEDGGIAWLFESQILHKENKANKE